MKMFKKIKTYLSEKIKYLKDIFNNEVLPKLKREWKTFALGVVSLLVTLYDALASTAFNWVSLVPSWGQVWVPVVIVALFFLLRKWRDDNNDVVVDQTDSK